MKHKTLLGAVLITALLSGCTANTNQDTSDPSLNHSGTSVTKTEHTDTATGSHSSQESNQNTAMISEEEARQIALSHAGLTANQVTFIKTEMDRDDGRINYDIEFYTADYKEYDYEIDPYTGKILDYDYDAEYYHADSAPATDQTGAATENTVTEDAAKQIALDQVPGAAAKDIVKFEKDYDNGRLVYEGEIHYEKKEYDFEIDGATGKILEWDAEPLLDR